MDYRIKKGAFQRKEITQIKVILIELESKDLLNKFKWSKCKECLQCVKLDQKEI